MDATLENRKWKVALAHFLLSMAVALILFVDGPVRSSGGHGQLFEFQQWYLWHESWMNLWTATFCFLQPQFWIFNVIGKSYHPMWLFSIIFLGSMVVWSICFGRLYVAFTNRLNHLPVFGKKVF